MGGQIVENYDIAFGQRWGELGFHIDFENAPIHRLVDDEGRGEAVTAQPGNECLGFPVPEGSLGFQSSPSRTASAKPHHLRIRTGFINKDQLARLSAHERLPSAPEIPRLFDVMAILFAGQQRFF